MRAIISGASSGIGRAIAERFLDAGFDVFGLDIKPAPFTRPAYTHFICDLKENVLPDIPDAEIVVSCAGTLEEADAIEVNLKGAIRFAERFTKSPVLKSVLFIASASARNGAEFPMYVASKAGLVGYMKNLALRLAGRGVTCNSISPGGVVTPMNRHILEDEKLYAAVRAETLLGKWCEAGEIADLAWYLTAVNRSMTGEDLLIDNGEMLKSNFIW